MGKILGLFDSGLGGLTVLNSLLDHCEYDKIVYFGDTERVPYGAHKKETILDYAKQDIRFLLSKGVDEIIVACATVTSNALEDLRAHFNIPITGIIDAAVKEAAITTVNEKVGVIATQATISSNVYEKSLKQINPSIEVFNKACPLFVPLIEYGFMNEGIEVAEKACEFYLKGLKDAGVDTLILGCTHYPMLKELILDFMGDKVNLIDVGVALQKSEFKKKIRKHPILNFYVSNEVEQFEKKMKSFITNKEYIEKNIVELVNIEEY